MQKILLSIAIPTFNRSQKLQSQLDSLNKVISKSRFNKSIELLVSDNFSDDSTSEVLNNFLALEKNYLFTVNKNSENLGADRNFGITIIKSSGKFVWILSDDDLVHSSAINFICESLVDNKEVGFCFVNHYVNEEKNFSAIIPSDENYIARNYEEFISKVMFAESMISSCIFKKSLLSKEDLLKYVGEGYLYMYWVAKIMQSKTKYKNLFN